MGDTNIVGRIVIRAQSDDSEFMHGATPFLDMRHLENKLYDLDGTDVLIDCGELRPGSEPWRWPGIRKGLSGARSVVIEGENRTTLKWLVDGLAGPDADE